MIIRNLKFSHKCEPGFDGIATSSFFALNRYAFNSIRDCVKAIYADGQSARNLMVDSGLLRTINSNGIELVVPSSVSPQLIRELSSLVDRVSLHLDSGNVLPIIKGLSVMSMTPGMDLLNYSVERLHIIMIKPNLRKGFNLLINLPLLNAEQLRELNLVFP